MSGSWFTELFGFKEETRSAAAWSSTRSRLSYDASTGTLRTPSGEFRAGHFSTPTLGDLRAAGRALLQSGAGGEPTLNLSHKTTEDVLIEHASAPAGSVFLAASGLNCLEFPGHGGSPTMGVTCYEGDRTQGPACALACAGGTVVRNYFSDNTPDTQIDCLATLADAIGGARAPWIVHAGYIRGSSEDGAAATAALNDANANFFARGSASRAALRALVRVGVHADTGVNFASRWRRTDADIHVTQVYAAALSLGGYKTPRAVPDDSWEPLATLVLEAAYEATLWAGVAAAARAGVPRGNVYLCGLGLGVFGNEPAWVANAIGRAVATLRAEGAALDVQFLHFREVSAALKMDIDTAAMRTYE